MQTYAGGRPAWVLAFVLLILQGVSAAACTSGCPQASTVPALNPARYADLQIFSASDVTCWSDSALPTSTISRAQAIAIATEGTAFSADDVRVLRGTGRHYPDGSERDVWIIVWPNNQTISAGPPGHEVQVQLTIGGSFVDAETGEVWRGFSF